MFLHQNFDAGLAEPTDAFRACIRILEPGDASTGGTVNLDGLRRVGRGRVRETLGAYVEVVAALGTFDGRERIGSVLVIRWGCERLLQWGCLVVVCLELRLACQWRQRCSGDGRLGHRGLWHLEYPS